MRSILLILLVVACAPSSKESAAEGAAPSGPAAVDICGTVWMTSNLDAVTYRNGDTIPQVRNAQEWMGLTTGAWCWYNNDPTASYGKLYNWYAVHDPRGLAPQGWHVPSDAEWAALETCLGPDSVGYRMRGTSATPWPGARTATDNSSGFNGLPGGMRSDSGTFSMRGDHAVFWTSVEGSVSEAWCGRLVHYVNNEGADAMATGVGYTSKTDGYSVRCVRDADGVAE